MQYFKKFVFGILLFKSLTFSHDSSWVVVPTNSNMITIESKIQEARQKHTTLFFQNGTYEIDQPLRFTADPNEYCNVEGESRENVIFNVRVSTSVGSLPQAAIILTNRGIETGKCTFKNFTIKGNLDSFPNQTAILLVGTLQQKFTNINIYQFKNGIHLFNDNCANNYTECNGFSDIWMRYCNNYITMERTSTDDRISRESFHGNEFHNISIRMTGGQTALRFINKPWYYNGDFNLHIWTNQDNGFTADTIIGGWVMAEANTGKIQVETSKAKETDDDYICPVIKFTGRFWYKGIYVCPFQPFNPIDLSENPADPSQKAFACDNYWKGALIAKSDFLSQAAPGGVPLRLHSNNFDGAAQGTIQTLWGGNYDYNMKSAILTTNQTSLDINGFYLANLPDVWYKQDGKDVLKPDIEENAKLGLFLSSQGTQIKSYSTSGLDINVKSGAISFGNNLKLNEKWISSNGSNNGIKILNSGNVGIGVNVPGDRYTPPTTQNTFLDVNGPIRSTGSLDVGWEGYVSGKDGRLSLSYDPLTHTSSLQSLDWNGFRNILINPNGGNVGIGTGATTPGVKLDVIGDAKISGNLTVGTSVKVYGTKVIGAQQSAVNVLPLTTTSSQTADAIYNTNEIQMINSLKNDIINLRAEVADLVKKLSAASGHGLLQ